MARPLITANGIQMLLAKKGCKPWFLVTFLSRKR